MFANKTTPYDINFRSTFDSIYIAKLLKISFHVQMNRSISTMIDEKREHDALYLFYLMFFRSIIRNVLAIIF